VAGELAGASPVLFMFSNLARNDDTGFWSNGQWAAVASRGGTLPQWVSAYYGRAIRPVAGWRIHGEDGAVLLRTAADCGTLCPYHARLVAALFMRAPVETGSGAGNGGSCSRRCLDVADAALAGGCWFRGRVFKFQQSKARAGCRGARRWDGGCVRECPGMTICWLPWQL
jgi:hypothetical protein